MNGLVSCIMPVRDRHAFIPGALACFSSQDYPHRELIVIDNGEHDCYSLMAGIPNVVYRRVPVDQHRIGGLRNIACEMARGEYIAHWDSDDWYGTRRLSEQVQILQQTGRDATGYHSLPFADDAQRLAWMYRGGEGYACGTSLMYLRATWAVHRFDSRPQYGEDNEFIRQMGGRLVSEYGRSIVARVHDRGTSPRDVTGWQGISYDGLATVGYPVMETSK